MRQVRTYLPLLALLPLWSACELGEAHAALGLPTGLADGGLYADPDIPAGSKIRFEPEGLELTDGVVALDYGQGQMLTVSLLGPGGDALEGATIRFALEGDAGGSSLTNVVVRTNEQGRANTFLTAGSVESSFRVRASALGVEAAFLDVEVSMVPLTKLMLTLSYDGAREIERYEVRAYALESCDSLVNALEQDLVSEQEVEGAPTTTTLELSAAHESLVLVVRALGPGDNVAATACAPFDPVVDEGSASLKLGLTDLPLRLSGTYPLAAQLDVSPSAERLADALLASLATTLEDSPAPNAARLLNGVQDTLADEEASDDANWVASQRDSLGPALEQALMDAGRGVTVAIGALAETVRSSATQLAVTAQMTASGTAALELAFSPLQLAARDANGETLAVLRFGEEYGDDAVAGSISADFDTTRSLLRIDALRLELGLGEYGDALLHGLADAPEGSSREALLAQMGCGELVSWAEGEQDLYMRCDGACLARACERALDTLLTDTRAQLAPLDADHAELGLRGDLPIYDVSGDGVAAVVETTELTGSWGRAESAMEPDVVSGSLGDPVEL